MSAPFGPEAFERLDAWLRTHLPALGDGLLHAESVSGGTSNVVVRLSRPDCTRPLILRKAPDRAPPASEKAIQREAMVLKALTGSRVPHPGFHGFSDDAGIVGGPFYIMDLVDGWAADLNPVTDQMSYRPDFIGSDLHYLAFAMIDGIIEMANLDYVAAGLGSFGKPEHFLERQAERWRSQMDSYPQRYPGYERHDRPGLDYVTDWLAANVPDTGRPGLMHGDYAMNNVMFANRPPARLAAIIDWETATIGDPMVDVAAYAGQLRRRSGVQPVRPYLDPAQFPYFEDAVDYFGEKTGRDVSMINYYLVLQKFRMTCILEYKVAEAAVGIAPLDKGRRFDNFVRTLLGEAEAIARATG
ncbi:phosphotransferase family protein [Sphingobium sp.]|uniref:phosphotransferase family protein n=1 Tax=Sphingobium sp. TaxID=1912891 RepID=UPI002BF6E5F0|nr:phosphotransferase family protein [Sphingobium sp.]HUD90094.1 phosphotransferase family protein [Sphingobium sp.]